MEKELVKSNDFDNDVYNTAINYLYKSCMDDDGFLYFLEKYQHQKLDYAEPITTKCNIKLKHGSYSNRMKSCRKFVLPSDKMAISIIEELFSKLHTSDNRRSYASGGAIYPVDIWVFISSERINTHLETGMYLYDFETHSFINHIRCTLADLVSCFHYANNELYDFSFCLLYTLNIDKAIKKYKNRGPILGIMEVGSIYQDWTLNAENNNIRNLVYGGFRLHQLSKVLNINQLHQFPVMMQLFGYGRED